jgi:uncharacterized protein involved in exopolysaccharide biosynthesis
MEAQLAQLQGTLMASGSGQLVTQQDQVEQLEAQLKQLKTTLTDEHPDVKDVQEKIARLRENIGTEKTVDGRQYRVNTVTRPLFDQLMNTAREITSLRKLQGSIMGQIGNLNARLANSPEVEQELSVLMRDLDKMRETYKDLQKKHMEAKQAETLEAQQQGRQFKIVDEARFPERPYKPNRIRLVALALTLGLMLGFVAMFVAEHLDHSFRDDEELASFTSKNVLAIIPRFTMEVDQIRRTNTIKLAIGAASALGFLLLLFIVLRFGFGFNPFTLLRQ